MITTNNTLRAIAALKQQDKSLFHENLEDYLIEALESLKTFPTSSQLQLLNKEIQFTLNGLPASRELEKAKKDIAAIISDWDEMA